MRRTGRRVPAWLAAALLLAAGCQKLHDERSVKLAPGDTKSFEIDAPRSEQKVTVEYTSSNGPVNVCVALLEDRQAAEEGVLADKKPDKALASKEKADSGTLEATVPAKKGFVVVIGGAKKETEVKVKTNGK
jgi:hypothetical protein